MLSFLGLVALLQQGGVGHGATTPPSGDTTGYWQQRVHYRIVATLDENQSKLRSNAILTYVNNSPDTLREMYFHQYLNAFRPGSKWSAADAREHRVRFQNLGENDIGYERLTEAPVVGGTPVIVDYPGAPDSTVMHFRLPRPLAPHDSLMIEFAWDARPSTVTRRQGRRGRTYDFAQWYPKVAVYDRGGWEPNPLVPAGELYGEYGTYDVTMVVKDDQVLASTGVPVEGDPGWARVSRTGAPFTARNAYGAAGAEDRSWPVVPPGYRAVTFRAENVHHFAWSASPDYIYEGTTYVRKLPATRFRTWDTVAVNVLYKPGDDTTWGGGRALERTVFAAKWLESIWGPYAYPQITNVHRLDPGGTEFPMMVMNGSASQGLILHEFGHVFSYGILGNNEWRSGWMDEGLTDYQTDWAEGLAPQDRDRIAAPPRLPEGYRVNAVTVPKTDSAYLDEVRLELLGRTQPIGTPAYDFREFGIYNEMIYNRAKLMYGQLRDLMGDSTFRIFLHDYYARWALRHVDEQAMRASAERAYGEPLGWFFDQWVHGTGLMDYQIGSWRINTDGQRYESIVDVTRRGELRHNMPVGVLTTSGWTVSRAEPSLDNQQVHVITSERPIRVELDPYHSTFDWDWRNNRPITYLISVPQPRITYNWPWLNQTDRLNTIVALAPAAWYTDAQGGVIGVRAKTNYLQSVDIHDGGIAFATRSPIGPSGEKPSFLTRAQLWARAENLYLPGTSRPLMGIGGAFNYVDGLLKLDVFRKWDLSPFIFTPTNTINLETYATVATPTDSLLVPEQWADVGVAEGGVKGYFRTPMPADSEYVAARMNVAGGMTANGKAGVEPTRGYLRAEGSVSVVRNLAGTASQLHVRVYGGAARNAPMQRAIFASSADPFETFRNDLFRGRGALFKQRGFNYLPIGGAALRGFAIDTPLDAAVAANGEVVQRLADLKGQWGRATFSASAFSDVGGASASRYQTLPDGLLSDAGVGLIARGKLYDRTVSVRLDAPLFVNHASMAGGKGLGGNGSFAPRWTITVGDVW